MNLSQAITPKIVQQLSDGFLYFPPEIAYDPDGNQAALVTAEPLGYSLATPNTPTTQLTPTTLQDLPENPALQESPTNKDDIARFTDFMELLAPPPTVPLYSDLLLHQMGSLGDGIAQAAAQPDEMRTAPLWGLRARAPFFHDGRASTVDTAIRLHDGEAATARNRYLQLTPQQQQAVLAFLNSI
jgi:cytochrome c peroxidase